MCGNFKCYSLNVVHYSSQVNMDAGLYLLCFFQRSLFLCLIFLNIIFILVSVVFF